MVAVLIGDSRQSTPLSCMPSRRKLPVGIPFLDMLLYLRAALPA
jgi:hypothetical protein